MASYIFQYIFIGIMGLCCIALSIYVGIYFVLKYLTKEEEFK